MPSLARPGVYVYRDADGGETRELVLPEELHKSDSLGTLGGKTVTDGHPAEDLDADNDGQYSVGTVMPEIEIVEDGRVKVVYLLKRKDAIERLKSGVINENSPGYTVEIEKKGGVHPEYGRYDAIQRNRIYNHAAMCEAARGGRSLYSRVDAAYMVTPHKDSDTMTKEDFKKMLADSGLKADATQKMMDMYEDRFEKLSEDKEKAEAAKADAEERAAALELERDALQAKWDSRHDWAEERAKLIERAQGAGVEVDAKADADTIRKTVVLAVNKDARQDASPDYYAAAFDMIKTSAATNDPPSFRGDSVPVGGGSFADFPEPV